MKVFSKILVATGAALALLPVSAWSAVGGGAVIHNAATLSYAGGQITAAVQVTVTTLASTPVFDVDALNVDSYTGDAATFQYTISSTANGTDTYSLTTDVVNNGVSAPTALTTSPATVNLGASVTSLDSDAAGNVYIPANSQTNLDAGDFVVITIGGNDYVYEISSVSPGTPSTTVGNTTTAEVPTSLALTPVTGGAPVIGAGVVPAGTQIGEQQTITVQVESGTPTTSGTDGTHTLTVNGATTALNGGSVLLFDDGLNATNTVLSGDGTLTKEVRNVTTGGSFATSGVTAQSGDQLEYRLTAASSSINDLTAAVIADTVPDYTTYVLSTTTLNGAAVADDAVGTTPFVLDEGGLQVNSATGAPGVVVSGETAEVTFTVLVD
jgi:hypothetical protein